MESGNDYEIEIWIKCSTAELLKKFRDEHGFEDNDEAVLNLIRKYEANNQ